MEVFRVYKSKLREVVKAIEACQGGYRIYKKRPDTWRSKKRQWDYIIRVCTGCSDPLSQYDNQKGHAFCFSCREVLFPETVNPYKSFGQRFHH
jgi:hypothetical protein